MASQAASWGEIWRPLAALILASLVVMGSPGPSTISATAMGAAFGFRRSLRYVAGLIAGTVVVLLVVALGVVALVFSTPYGARALGLVAAGYILFLAFKIASAPPLGPGAEQTAAPAFGGGWLLAVANPKAYLAIAAVFAGTRLAPGGGFVDAGAKIALLSVMIVLIHLFWLAAGVWLSRMFHDPARSRLLNLGLAAGLVIAALAGIAG